jgi:hypothetical protein
MSKKTFIEYLSDKGITVEKPVITPVADYNSTAPSKPQQGKNSAPYTNPGTPPEKYRPKDDKSGFAHKGKSNLKYEPGVTGVAKAGEGGKKLNSYPHVKSATPKSEAFFNATKDMNIVQYAQFVGEQNKAGDKNASQPVEYIKYTTSLVAENANLATSLVQEAKRQGVLSLLVFEALQQDEAVQTLVDMMGDPVFGPSLCRRLSRKLSEEASPPVTPEDGSDEEDPNKPKDPNNPEASTDDEEIDPNAPPDDAQPPPEEDPNAPQDPNAAAAPPGMPPGMPPQPGAVENMLNALSDHALLLEVMYKTVAKRIYR